jgi:hypothetical protein
MPWRIRPDHPDCAGYAVVNTETGKVERGGCHRSRADALAHQRALQVNVEEAAVTDTALPATEELAAQKQPCPPGMTRNKQGLCAPKSTADADTVTSDSDTVTAQPAPPRRRGAAPPRPGMRQCPPGMAPNDQGDCVPRAELALREGELDAHIVQLQVDNSPWDGNAAMSSCSDAACYRAICAGRKAGPPDQRASWALPHHSSAGAGPNAAGTRNALARFAQTQGLTNQAEARAHLERHMASIRNASESSGLTGDQWRAWLDADPDDLRTPEEFTAGGPPNPGTPPDSRLTENQQRKRKRRTSAATDSRIEATGDGRVEGILVIEGIPTGDGREFAPGSLSVASLPLPLTYQPPTHGGQPGPAIDVGVITEVWADETDARVKRFRGQFDLADAGAADVYRKVSAPERFLKGVSVDVDDIDPATDVELIWPEGAEGEGDELAQLFIPPSKKIYHKGRIRGAAVLSMPAFVETQLWPEGAEEPPLPDLAAVEESARTDEGDAMLAAGLASLDAYRPPLEWFTNPTLGQRCPIVVTSEGRVYGHAARWGECHIGYGDDHCVTVPRETDFPYFTQGTVVCAGGEEVAVGQITLNTGHAPKAGVTWRKAAEHYDHTGAAVADVAVGADRVGIWVAGAIRPGATAEQVYALRASGQVSGDWRYIGGRLRLVALLGVNVPGFPVPRAEARLAGGQVVALTAAGMLDLAQGDVEADLDQRALRLLLEQTLPEEVLQPAGNGDQQGG